MRVNLKAKYIHKLVVKFSEWARGISLHQKLTVVAYWASNTEIILINTLYIF